jgi:hypothetical protein
MGFQMAGDGGFQPGDLGGEGCGRGAQGPAHGFVLTLEGLLEERGAVGDEAFAPAGEPPQDDALGGGRTPGLELALDAEMAAMGIRMISPNRTGTRRTQDGRELRRYKRRWKVERLFSWLGFSRRLTVRYERYIENFEAFLHLASFFILFKRL